MPLMMFAPFVASETPSRTNFNSVATSLTIFGKSALFGILDFAADKDRFAACFHQVFGGSYR